MNIHKHKAEDYPYLFRTSAFSIFNHILFISILIILGLYFIYTQEYVGFLIVLFWVALSKSTINEIINNRIIIKLNHNGIWTRKTNFLTWEKIKKINFIFTNDESDMEIILKKGKKKIRISVGKISNVDSLTQLVNHFLDQENFKKQKERNKNWKQFV